MGDETAQADAKKGEGDDAKRQRHEDDHMPCGTQVDIKQKGGNPADEDDEGDAEEDDVDLAGFHEIEAWLFFEAAPNRVHGDARPEEGEPKDAADRKEDGHERPAQSHLPDDAEDPIDPDEEERNREG